MSEINLNYDRIILINASGIGAAPPGPGNAVSSAETPNLDELWGTYPHGTLKSSGRYIGLPEGTPSNSELGLLTIGAGRTIYQDKLQIDLSIDNKTFLNNPELLSAIEHAIKNESDLHIVGLLDYKNNNSSIDHLYELITLIKSKGLKPDRLFIHGILDGEKENAKNILKILEELESFLASKRIGRIASLIGSAYTMYTKKHWDRYQKAYEIYVKGKGFLETSWHDYLIKSFKA
ncbi:MAG: 2,3-bisphosphoglycerate-independent phosphoglycerate mutase, partial [Candidatus Dojkabacteria bacterium]|nr:2,3-bisphosphoglycerate-independent phosphoglycerate mutase [Candidatus Dojkabacteria bacterium]